MKSKLFSEQFEKKTLVYYDQMADAELSFQQCLFLSEFHIIFYRFVSSLTILSYSHQGFCGEYLDLFGFDESVRR